MILCCGESLIDMLPRTASTGEPAFAPVAGGAVFNTAIALGRLGAPAGYFGGLSTDLFGAVLETALTASRVDFTLSVRSQRPTTLAFVTLTDGHAQYAFYDENTAGRSLTEADLPHLGDETEALFFGGISLVSEPAADTYAALCAQAGERLVMMDPNIRPSFITDPERYRARLAQMLARADVVKISDEDMAWLGTTPAELIAGGAALVLETRGAAGVLAVGAGDTFNAGFLAGLWRDGLLSRASLRAAPLEALQPAIALGAKAAAVTVSRAGANPPWDTELAEDGQ
ncbi:carbohydrate kinase [Salipiger sp. HF18]|uniref:carbohydrate kinase family protein n=1 Tax=Salipiger sp. HF18 TaxID=2721557 RepID=UPI00142D698E|nr:carbohydrate kinase [Salipiger sp. HF18]NIY97565.1 carbohydrate kinase [Salipiger sp. HF18]